MAAYPVMFDVARPEKMGRAHVFLRILLVILVSSVAGSGDGFGLIYLGLPVVAAILIAQKSGDRYLAENGETMTKVLAFIVGFLAYVALLTDELPGLGHQNIAFGITRTGSPTVGSALWRIVKAIPSRDRPRAHRRRQLARLDHRGRFHPHWRALSGRALELPARRHPLAGPAARLPRLARRVLSALLVRDRAGRRDALTPRPTSRRPPVRRRPATSTTLVHRAASGSRTVGDRGQ